MRTIASSTLAEKDEASGDCFDDDTIVGHRKVYRIKYSRCTVIIRTCAHKEYNNICTIATSGLRGVDVLYAPFEYLLYNALYDVYVLSRVVVSWVVA
jgi:hypothetical protein